MSRGKATTMAATISFPRVSGDEPAEALLVREQVGFSPRERG